jgi:hypothetical protein
MRATGQVIRFPGFLAVYQEGFDDSEDDESGLLPVAQTAFEVASEIIFELLFESHAEKHDGRDKFLVMRHQKHVNQLAILRVALFGNGEAIQPVYTTMLLPDPNGLHPYPILACAGIMAGLRVKKLPQSQHFDKLRWWQDQLVRKLSLPLKTVHRHSKWCYYLESTAAALQQGGLWESAFLGIANSVASPELPPRDRLFSFCSALFQEAHSYDAQLTAWSAHWDSVLAYIEEEKELDSSRERKSLTELFHALRAQDWDMVATLCFRLDFFDLFSFATLFRDLETLLVHFSENLVHFLGE